MIRIAVLSALCLVAVACGESKETTRATQGPITESVYASGIIESKDQYEVFATVSGIVQEVYVSEGDTVKVGTALLSIFNETQQLNKENARAAASFADMGANADKLRDAQLQIANAKTRMDNDSVLLDRQRRLWEQKIGAQVTVEQRQLAYDNAMTAYRQAIIRHADLKRQLQLSATQASNNLRISGRMESDFMPRSSMDGVVYRVLKQPGELVGPQTPLAVIGDAKRFVLKMQVDEQDIFRMVPGLKVMVTLDSYPDQVFEARVSKVLPLMNQRNKTFEVEAEFVQQPERLLPNITFEANVIINEKPSALLLPRRFMLNDSMVVLSTGDTIEVTTGLHDYQQMEILSGIGTNDEVALPAQ